MESNISRDHIALEAMKCMMMTAKRRRTLWNRVVTLFFPSKEASVTNYYYEGQAKSAYQIADAMIKERNKTKEESADRYFKCKLYFITLDEKTGAEKKTSTNILVQAADLRDAVKKLDEGMKGTMADYVIASVSETAIMDVYPYEANSDVKPEFPNA